MGKLLLAANRLPMPKLLLNASALSPDDVRWSYYLAHVYRLQGESQKAASYFERALQSRRDDVAALVWLGSVYLDQGRPVDAGSLFSRALALDSRVAAARVGLGRVALAARDYAGAIEHSKPPWRSTPARQAFTTRWRRVSRRRTERAR